MSSSLSDSPSSTSSPPPSCTTAVPGRYGNVPFDACNSNYNFNPQFAPAVAVATIFGLLTALHVGLAVLFRKRYAWVVIMGALWETLAFILLSRGSRHQQNSSFAIAHTLLYFLAPLWINAFVYMTLARTVYMFAASKRVWIVPAVSMSKYFVWADIVTFMIQATGGILTAPTSDSNTIRTGLDVYLAGLGCQELVILGFIGLMIVFHRDILACDATTNGSYSNNGPSGFTTNLSRPRWRGLVYTLYSVLVFISLRIVYRITEYSGGTSSSNPLPYHEVYSYTLDALPMMLCLLLLAINHPGRALRGPDAELPRKERKDRKAEKLAKKERKLQIKAKKKEQHQQKGTVHGGYIELQHRFYGQSNDEEANVMERV